MTGNNSNCELTGNNFKVGNFVVKLKKVQSFRQAAEKACSSDDSSEWQCTDLCLISAILDAFGLPEDQNLQIAKKINGAETQWTLGDSFHLM